MYNKLDSIKQEDCVFFNYPAIYSLEEYRNTIDKVGKKNFGGNIKAIYTNGIVSNPGISDIDILIVIKNNTSPRLKFVWLDKKERNMICHPFYIIDETIMNNIRWIYPDFNLRLIKGHSMISNQPTKNELRLIRIFLMIDVILRHFPSDYLEMLVTKWISVRDALLRLNALNHSIATFKFIGLKKKEWDSYTKEIKKLRNMWFNIKREEQNNNIVKLLKKATYISIDITSELSQLLEKEGIVKIKHKTKEIIYNGKQNRAFFVENWNKDNILKRMIDFYPKNKKFYSVLPLNFLPLLLEYSKNDALLGNYIKKHLENSEIEYQIDGKNMIKKRMELLNRQAFSAFKMKHRHFTAFFDFGYKSTAGMLNKGLYVIRKIKNSKIFKGLIFIMTRK